MVQPSDKQSAFAGIAEDLELSIVLLFSRDSSVQLSMVGKIGNASLSVNRTWRDLASVSPRRVRRHWNRTWLRLRPCPPT